MERMAMRFDGEMIAGALVLLILGALVGGILLLLVGFWRECVEDTSRAQVWVAWPTTTVQATLFDTSLRRFGKKHGVVGHYKFEFGGSEHTAEVYEDSYTLLSDADAAARVLKEEGKTTDLEVQYNPEDSSMVSNDIVTSVPKCRYWVGGFFLFFCLIELLILRGLSRTVPAIFR
jgi:hypothetical protein